MDALGNMKMAGEKQGWEWASQAREMLERYTKTICPRCKYGIARATTGTNHDGKHTIHLRMYCQILSMDVYDNGRDDLDEVINTCDSFDDSPDDD